METFRLEKDIPVFCVPASSFPEGIAAAHEKLHSLIPFSGERRYFGMSHPNRSGIIEYKAAAEELQKDEAQRLACERFVINKGSYVCLTLTNYNKDPQSISRAFETLLKHPKLDPQGYCLEWYISENEVRCMVGITS